jgi:small subunit ribosomal protein S21
MHIVHVYKGEEIDRALKRLKAKMDIDDVLEEVKNRRSFETSAQKRKRKQKSLDRKRKRNR